MGIESIAALCDFEWYEELYRVLEVDGIMILTTQGDNFKVKLSEGELEKYEAGELVVRGNVKEGHRTYSTFHPNSFMAQLFSNARIEAHIIPDKIPGRALPQDVWIVRKV